MKAETLFLKLVVYFIGLIVLALCIFWLPWMANEFAESSDGLIYLLVIDLYASAIPFFIALYHTLKLLHYIDKNIAFSERSVKSLKYIKYCAFSVSILYVLILPLLYVWAKADDAPGVLAIGLVIVFASFVIAVFAAVLEKLLKAAIDIKSENDLTV